MKSAILIFASAFVATKSESEGFDRKAIIVHTETGKCVNFHKKRFFDKSSNAGGDCTELLVKTYATNGNAEPGTFFHTIKRQGDRCLTHNRGNPTWLPCGSQRYTQVWSTYLQIPSVVTARTTKNRYKKSVDELFYETSPRVKKNRPPYKDLEFLSFEESYDNLLMLKIGDEPTFELRNVEMKKIRVGAGCRELRGELQFLTPKKHEKGQISRQTSTYFSKSGFAGSKMATHPLNTPYSPLFTPKVRRPWIIHME